METENHAASAEAGAQQPIALDMDAAASALSAMEDEDTQAVSDKETAKPASEDEGTPPESDDDGEDQPDNESEPDAETEDDEVVHGNKLLVLRDGTKVRAAELKKLWGLKPELERQQTELQQRQQQIAAAAQEFQSRQAQIAQQTHLLQQLGPLMLAKAQAALPPEPNPDLINPNSPNYDPIRHYEEQQRYQHGVRELQQIQHGLASFNQQKQAEYQRAVEQQTALQRQQYEAWAKKEYDTLLDEMPELSDPAKATSFRENMHRGAKAYGFTEKQLSEVTDRRLFKALADLGQFQALRSQKPVVDKKIASAPPVKAPGRRVSEGEVNARSRKELFDRASSGRLEDVASAIAMLD